MKGLLIIGLLCAALVAGGVGYVTGEWEGWVFAGLFGAAFVYELVKKN